MSAIGVALVASAAKGLCAKICPDRFTAFICTFAACFSYYYPKPWRVGAAAARPLAPTTLAAG